MIMKAIRIHQYGGPEVLAQVELQRPTPGPNEVLIKVHAASVNPVDWKVKTVVDTVLPLAEARCAHELSQSGHARGKIVLKAA